MVLPGRPRFFFKLCNRNICEKSSSAGPGIATKEGQQLLAAEALLEARKKKCFKEQYAVRCIVAVHQDGWFWMRYWMIFFGTPILLVHFFNFRVVVLVVACKGSLRLSTKGS